MNAYLPAIVELSVLVLIWTLATGLSSPLRRRLHRDAGRPTLPGALLDLAAHLSRPVLALVVTRAVVLALGSWPAAVAWLAGHANHLAAWEIFWLGLAALALVEGFVQLLFRLRNRPFPVPDLLMDIIRAVLVLAVAFLVLRVELGIDIGPLLASTALVTAVVGFALQGVLGNLLAGMSLHLVRSLRPGVWVDIDGLEGKVVKTNWRETRLRTMDGHLYILPNARVAEAKIHNMNEPTPLRRHVIEVGASYSDAPDEVIAALVAAARSVPQVRANPAPAAMITAFLDFGINYRLEFWTNQYHRHIPIDGDVNRMIWYQFKRRGIEIPFPMSDKLLNDFMAVVYNQRRLPPTGEDLEGIVEDLWRSDLCRTLVVDADGTPLLSRENLARVAPHVRRLPFTHGEVLCRQGDEGDSFWVVARGELAGRVEQDGQTAATFTLGPGTVVGEMSPLTGVPRSATLTVATGAELLEFGPEAFRALLSLHEEIPRRLADLAAERAAANREALEKLAAERERSARVELEQPGILRRLLRIVGR